MLKRILPALLCIFFVGAASSGCVLHTHHGHGRQPAKHKKAKKTARECPPSHYWDGKKCRHKGKGKGARKHDF